MSKNPQRSSTTEINKHTSSGYSLFMHCSFDVTESKHDCYRGKDRTKNLSGDLKKYAAKIRNYEKKEMIPLTYEENRSYHKQNTCYICKKEFSTDDSNEISFKKHYKGRYHCHYTGKNRGASHNVCNLRYKTPKEIPVAFRNGSKNDYRFLIKELAENAEKCLTFTVPIKKELQNNKKITYKIKFIDSLGFTSSSLSSLSSLL